MVLLVHINPKISVFPEGTHTDTHTQATEEVGVKVRAVRLLTR